MDCGILFHIGGFLLKGIMKEVGACEHCKTAVLGTSTSEHSYLAALKEYVRDGNNLHYPSDAVMRTLKYCEELFRGIITWTDSVLTVKSPLQAVTTYLGKMSRCNLQTCEQHKETVEKRLIASFARLRLRIHLRQVAKRVVDGNASKTCAGVNLP